MSEIRILNLTQHVASPQQVAQGVVEPQDKKVVQELITFDKAPTITEMVVRAEKLVAICREHGCDAAMIGGAVYFQPVLEDRLKLYGITPLYSFSRRVAVEEIQPDGSTKKTQVSSHTDWAPKDRYELYVKMHSSTQCHKCLGYDHVCECN